MCATNIVQSTNNPDLSPTIAAEEADHEDSRQPLLPKLDSPVLNGLQPEEAPSESGSIDDERGIIDLPSPRKQSIGFSERWKICRICACLIFVFHIASFMRAAPKVRLFELGLCREYFQVHDPAIIRPDGSVAEADCKIVEIQRGLAFFKGWLSLFESLPGIRNLSHGSVPLRRRNKCSTIPEV